MKGAISKAEELAVEIPNSWIPSQFDNPANVDAHRKYTAQEIINDFPEGLDDLTFILDFAITTYSMC